MITFLRKIRRHLLQENRYSKYLLYAVGEIILVMIGILLALQVNNWNEARKNNRSERDYYCRLLADFELDRQNIARLTEESDYKIKTSNQLLIDLASKQKDKSYLINNYIQALRTNAFTPSKVTILDITSSGGLNLIKDDLLKTSLIRYYAELDNLLYQLGINRDRTIGRAFDFDEDNPFGFQYADYVEKALWPEAMNTLPNIDWQLDENSKRYKQFQQDLVFFITMSDREKQHFRNILQEMEPVYRQLKKLCVRHD